MSTRLDTEPLSERITRAIRRVTIGHGSMSIPPQDDDPDLVLAACRDRIGELEEWKSNAEAELEKRPTRELLDVVVAERDALQAQVADLVTSANSTPSST